jgi:hypothetical protein
MAVSHALVVKLDAKPDRAEDVATFLAGAQPLAEAEPGTVSWYAARTSATTFWRSCWPAHPRFFLPMCSPTSSSDRGE